MTMTHIMTEAGYTLPADEILGFSLVRTIQEDAAFPLITANSTDVQVQVKATVHWALVAHIPGDMPTIGDHTKDVVGNVAHDDDDDDDDDDLDFDNDLEELREPDEESPVDTDVAKVTVLSVSSETEREETPEYLGVSSARITGAVENARAVARRPMFEIDLEDDDDVGTDGAEDDRFAALNESLASKSRKTLIREVIYDPEDDNCVALMRRAAPLIKFL